MSDASTFKRVLRTPISQLLRGDVSPRLTIAQRIEQAHLNPSLTHVIIKVVRRTRLWPRERMEVARELIAHFQDGIESGSSAEQLIHSFGDLKHTAKLIRRAKKRQRPLWWRTSKRGVQGVLLLPVIVLLVYIPLAIRFFMGSPTISHDYLTDMNRAALSVPDHERAWPMYREALLNLPDTEQLMADVSSQTYLISTAMKPGHVDWPLAERFVTDRQKQIALIRRAAKMPGLGFVLGPAISPEDRRLWPSTNFTIPAIDAPLVQVQMPYLGELRRLAQWLVLDSRRGAAAGDSQSVIDNFDAMLNIAGHTRENPTLIADLVSMAILQMTFDRVGEFLADQPQLFSDEQLHRLAHRIAAIRDEDIRLRLDGERMWFNDLLQRSYTDDGNGDGRLTPQAWAIWELLNGRAKPPDWGDAMRAATGPAYSMVAASRRELVQEFDRLINETEANGNRPMWEREESTVDRQLNDWMNSPIDRMRYMPIALLMPALDKATQQQHFVRFGRDVTLTVIALELHRRANGDWPESLDALTPSMMPAVPRDLFDGMPLKYVVRDGLPVLYSVGSDRDDDGGRAVPEHPALPWTSLSARRWVPRAAVASALKSGRIVDGDWIVWPLDSRESRN